MIDTFEALAVFVLAVLPGALYTWGFESQAGQWGSTAGDRLLRFVAGSAVFHAIFAPVTYWVWLRFVHSGRLGGHGAVPFYLWPIALAYVAVPFAAGSLSGNRCVSRTPNWLTRLVNGRNPAPRAWDHVFVNQRRPAWVRVKLKSGPFIGGLYANLGTERSYASGFSYDQELFLVRAVRTDSVSGEFRRASASSPPTIEPFGILVRWDEVEYLDIEEDQHGR